MDGPADRSDRPQDDPGIPATVQSHATSAHHLSLTPSLPQPTVKQLLIGRYGDISKEPGRTVVSLAEVAVKPLGLRRAQPLDPADARGSGSGGPVDPGSGSARSVQPVGRNSQPSG